MEAHDAAGLAAHLLALSGGQGEHSFQLLRQILSVIRFEEVAVHALLHQVRQSQRIREYHGGGGAHRLQGHQGLQLGGTGLAEHVSHLVHLGQMLIRNEAAENHAVGHAAIVRLLLESLTQLATTGDVQHHVLEGIR